MKPMALLLLTEYNDFRSYFNQGEYDIGGLKGTVDQVGSTLYQSVLTVSIWVCAISLLLTFVSRLIFRIASPREDAHTKYKIQTIFLIIFIISFLTTLFAAIINVADGL